MRSMCCRQGSLKSLALHHSHSLWYSDTRNLQWDCSTHPGPLQLGPHLKKRRVMQVYASESSRVELHNWNQSTTASFCMGDSSHLEVRTRPFKCLWLMLHMLHTYKWNVVTNAWSMDPPRTNVGTSACTAKNCNAKIFPEAQAWYTSKNIQGRGTAWMSIKVEDISH